MEPFSPDLFIGGRQLPGPFPSNVDHLVERWGPLGHCGRYWGCRFYPQLMQVLLELCCVMCGQLTGLDGCLRVTEST